MNKHIILKVILGKVNTLPDNYNIKNDYKSIFCSKVCPCCCKKRLKNKEFQNKIKIYDNCNQAIQEKMDLSNYLNDSMDFRATSHLLLKSRHRILIPLLNLHMISKKKHLGYNYKNTFIKNMHERLDLPVFSVEDAISQIKKNLSGSSNQEKDSIQRAMDEFFMTNLPRDIIDLNSQILEKSNVINAPLGDNQLKVFSQQNIANIEHNYKGDQKMHEMKIISKNKVAPFLKNTEETK